MCGWTRLLLYYHRPHLAPRARAGVTSPRHIYKGRVRGGRVCVCEGQGQRRGIMPSRTATNLCLGEAKAVIILFACCNGGPWCGEVGAEPLGLGLLFNKLTAAPTSIKVFSQGIFFRPSFVSTFNATKLHSPSHIPRPSPLLYCHSPPPDRLLALGHDLLQALAGLLHVLLGGKGTQAQETLPSRPEAGARGGDDLGLLQDLAEHVPAFLAPQVHVHIRPVVPAVRLS